jgi:asparagine synthase (glutamine-hydrolysing)
MCGIVGTYSVSGQNVELAESIRQLSKRGPDRQAVLSVDGATLGHTRLSILDTSALGDQPMQDPTGRYTLVFNGEIYNYRAIAKDLVANGVQLISNSDTEVLLHLLIHEGEKGLARLNGFFAFAFHDKFKNEILIARDRYGIKPLYYALSEGQLIFGSELKAITPLLTHKTINLTALHFYFMLNYVPGDMSIFNEVEKLSPGSALRFSEQGVAIRTYVESNQVEKSTLSYEQATKEVRKTIEQAVEDRLIADVPLGCFLSGGIDSSVISAVASKQKKGIKTFSIGFKDNAFFDESSYSSLVAEHLGTDHHIFQLSNEQMLTHAESVLDYIDEPFADSSSIAVHALSKMTRGEVTVSLSGDGADELFGGYNKHAAHLRAMNTGLPDTLLKMGSPLLKFFTESRASSLGNIARQAKRYLNGAKMSARERYWLWASFCNEAEVNKLILPGMSASKSDIDAIKARYHDGQDTMQSVFNADLRMLLPGDFLPKVDRMSMANSLEVRVPFLDQRVVDLAMSLPVEYRIDSKHRKRILKDAFRDMLPAQIFERGKKGFEVPLESWFKGPLKQRVLDALDYDKIEAEGILSPEYVARLREKVTHNQVGADVHQLWALVVFDSFRRKYL